MPTVSFSLTRSELAIVAAEAGVRGLTASAYAKNALATHIQKYGRPENREAWEDPNRPHEGRKPLRPYKRRC